MVNNQMRITGFASGLDTTQIITDLMRAERMPLDNLFQKREWLEWQRDAYRDVNLELATFNKSVDKLRFQYSFNGYKASASDSSLASVTAKGSAVPGNYTLSVNSIAEVAKVTSANAITSGGSNVKLNDKILATGETTVINIETATGNQDITIDDTTTYGSLASKIANLTDASGKSLGLRASFDEATSRFVISTKDLGANQKITISDRGTFGVANAIVNGGAITPTTLTPTGPQAAGKNAEVVVNGATVTSSTNNLSVFGMDIKVLKSGGPTNVSISSDTQSIFDNIKKFVDDYNSLIDSLNTKLKEKRNRDFPPLTDEQREALSEKEVEKWDEAAKKGLLSNDSIIRGTLNELRVGMYSPVDSIPTGNIRMLSEIGITTEYLSTDGKLVINEEKLRAAITDNPDEIMNLFTKEDGIASRIYNEVNSSIDKLNKKAGRVGSPDNLNNSVIGQDLSELRDRMKVWENKLAMIENRYWKQFTAMEQALAKFNEQSSSIMGMMGF
ncbi:flagellar filament capping protein FliD [Bacillus sp. JJ1521]|uniref:flagellar filament capping protein FliD n=1 Tax=Bacillus sp. JJ1521 TaxID=3122957 RepID=UPI0030001CEB